MSSPASSWRSRRADLGGLALLLALAGAVGVASDGTKPSVRALTEEGMRLLEDRHYHQAQKSFEEALAIDPASTPAREGLARSHAGLGVEFANAGENRLARESFERALRNAEDTVARFGLGYIDFLEMRDGPARDNLDRALALDPKDARTLKLLALLDYRKGDTRAALSRIEKSVALDPKDEEAEAFRKRWGKEAELSPRLGTSSTAHFLVRADRDLHPDGVREIRDALERIHDSLGKALGHWPKKQVPVVLLRETDFHAATGSYHWVGGVYDGQIKVPVKEAEGRPGADRAVLLRTLRHEYAHVVVKEICPGCPNWLNEGVAQYFEFEDAGGEAGPSKDRETRDRRVREELRKNREHRIPFEKVPARIWEISDQDLARWTYIEGLGFVSWLVAEHRAFRLRLLLAAYRREGSLTRAFETTYGSPLVELESSFWRSLD